MDDDFEEWFNMTALGSSYEEQFCPRTGKWRHKPLTLGAVRGDYEISYGAWIPGRASPDRADKPEVFQNEL